MPKAISVLQHNTILDSINEGIFTVDLCWGIQTFNAAAERITRVDRSKAVMRKCHQVLRSNLCHAQCAMKKTLTTGESVVNAMACIVNAKGVRVPVRISTALLRDEHGHVIGGVETFQDLNEVERLHKEMRSRHSCEGIIGRSTCMRYLFRILPQIADSDSTVLIQGASGTGKDLFAKTIHSLSRRASEPFVAVNCGALPDALLESELFGYKAGAFTDAKRDKPGRFHLAQGGTIFLDEIGDISPALQVRLLRVLQERTIEPLGSIRPEKVDVRILAATNKSLEELIRQGKFREDLYYRIRVVKLELPLLKDRVEDVPLLVEYLIDKFNRSQGKDIAGISEHALARLVEHDFPGNIRELENIIERAFIFCRAGLIEEKHLRTELRGQDVSDMPSLQDFGETFSLREMERILIVEALERFKGCRKLASQSLGIDVSTLYRKIKGLGIQTPATNGRKHFG